MSVFIKKGHFCIIQKKPHEIQEHFMYRGYSIISQSPSSQEEFDKNNALSNYLVNIKFLGCSYSDQINDKCKVMDHSIFS